MGMVKFLMVIARKFMNVKAWLIYDAPIQPTVMEFISASAEDREIRDGANVEWSTIPPWRRPRWHPVDLLPSQSFHEESVNQMNDGSCSGRSASFKSCAKGGISCFVVITKGIGRVASDVM